MDTETEQSLARDAFKAVNEQNMCCADFMERHAWKRNQARAAYIEAIRPISRLAALMLSQSIDHMNPEDIKKHCHGI